MDESERKKAVEMLKEMRQGDENNTGNENRLTWMYKGPNEMVDREAYLLGKVIDKSFETQNSGDNSEIMSRTSEPSNVPKRLLSKPESTEQVDIAKKILEDPLYAIKQKELEARRKLLDNPVKLKEIKKMLMERSLEKMKKKAEKKKKKKKDREKDEKRLDKLILKKLLMLSESQRRKLLKEAAESSDTSTESRGTGAERKKLKKRRLKRGETSGSSSETGSSSEGDDDHIKHKKNSDVSKRKKGMPRENVKDYPRKNEKNEKSERNKHGKRAERRDELKGRTARERSRKKKKYKKRSSSSSSQEESSSGNTSSDDSSSKSDSSSSSSRSSSSGSGSSDSVEHKKRKRVENFKMPQENNLFRSKRSDDRKYSTRGDKNEKSFDNMPKRKGADIRKKERGPDSDSCSDYESKRRRDNRSRYERNNYSTGGNRSKMGNNSGRDGRRDGRSYNEKAYNSTSHPPQLSEKEREAKLKEMMENAKIRKEDRERSLADHRKNQREEEKLKDYDDGFMRRQISHATSHGTMADRIRSNVNNIQRSKADMETSFVRKK